MRDTVTYVLFASILSVSLTAAPAAFAGDSTGEAALIFNDDETVLVIHGPPAVAMFARLDVPAEKRGPAKFAKFGRHYYCVSDTGAVRCVFTLTESRSGQLTGEVQ